MIAVITLMGEVRRTYAESAHRQRPLWSGKPAPQRGSRRFLVEPFAQLSCIGSGITATTRFSVTPEE